MNINGHQLRSNDLTNSAVLGTFAGEIHRGGLRWILILPPKSPKIFCISPTNTLEAFPCGLSHLADAHGFIQQATLLIPFDQHQLVPLLFKYGTMFHMVIFAKQGVQGLR